MSVSKTGLICRDLVEPVAVTVGVTVMMKEPVGVWNLKLALATALVEVPEAAIAWTTAAELSEIADEYAGELAEGVEPSVV